MTSIRSGTRRAAAIACSLAVLGCAAGDGPPSASEKAAARAEIETALREAYDLSKPHVPERMLSLYGDSGRVVSATAGRVVTSRDSLATGIRYFWFNVGINMRDPRWVWDSIYVDVLSARAAAVTATYHIPHRNPRNEPHVLAGALTAVFEKRGDRWVIVQEHLSDLPSQDSTATPGNQ